MKKNKRDPVAEYAFYMRNIANACLVLSEWTHNHGGKSPEEITFGDVCFAQDIYSLVLDITTTCNLEVKTV